MLLFRFIAYRKTSMILLFFSLCAKRNGYSCCVDQHANGYHDDWRMYSTEQPFVFPAYRIYLMSLRTCLASKFVRLSWFSACTISQPIRCSTYSFTPLIFHRLQENALTLGILISYGNSSICESETHILRKCLYYGILCKTNSWILVIAVIFSDFAEFCLLIDYELRRQRIKNSLRLIRLFSCYTNCVYCVTAMYTITRHFRWHGVSRTWWSDVQHATCCVLPYWCA